MKKLFALLLTVVMMASMMVPAMAAYSAVTPGDADTHLETIPHSLKLTDPEATELMYTITYKYAVSDAVIIDATNNGFVSANQSLAVTGKPSIADLVYSPEDTFSKDNKTAEKELKINWAGVSITEPGIYRWTVTQSVSSTAPEAAGKPSNAEPTFYLYMYVTDTGNGLQPTFRWSKVADETTGHPVYTDNKKDTIIPEQFPVETIDLTLTKSVKGTQASKDQYFPFKIVLTAPKIDGDNPNNVTNTEFTYSITATTKDSYDTVVPKTAYHDGTTNPSQITVKNGSTGVFYIWLKDGQSVTINNLVYGTEYEIVEEGNAGYKVTTTVVGDIDGATYGENISTVKDTSMIVDSTVSFLNEKDLTIPTGISLQSGAAFFGIVLAMGMMMLMFVGKRKEQN